MILNNEYPAPNPTKRNLLTSLLFGLFISFFLIFFEPFEIEISNGKNTIESLLLFGVISAFVLIVFLFILPLFFPTTFSDRSWTIKHQILYCSAILFTIATFNGLYTNHINSLSFSWSNYWWIINRTFVLGSIPFSFFILVDYKRRDAKNKQEAKGILKPKNKNPEARNTTSHLISTDLKKEKFTFEDSNFTHAVAVGNYTDLFFFSQGKLTSKTYRISLTSFAKQLNTPHLRRCHRSYLINIHQVTNVSGNAQGLKLSLADGASEVSVSRKYIPDIKASLSKLNDPKS